MAAYALTGIFVMGCLVYLMESYVIRCPEQAEWSIRAKIRCQNTTKYFCLYNYITYSYEEGCTGPDWDRPGSKRVYSRNFNRRPCNDTRYQPIKFVTNGNSDCIFRKSLCTEEGQILFTNGTTETDSTCRCDYTQGYAFVTVPRNKCSCRPSEEDCSCYLKKCQGIGYNLSADYECTNDITKKTDCPLMSENPFEDPHIEMKPTGTSRENDSYIIRRKFDVAFVVLGFLVCMIVSLLCAMFKVRLLRCLQLSTKEDGNRQEEKVSGNIEDNRIALMESDENRKSAFEKLKDNMQKNGLAEVFQSFSEVIDNSKNGPVKLAVTGKSGIVSSDGNWIYVLVEFKENIDKDGLKKALKHYNEDLDSWKNEPVKLAVTGKSGVGKSSFINAIRNLKKGDQGFAASSSSGNTTKRATFYEYPGNHNITLHDLPGFGTIQLPTNDYEKTMELHKYDYILIFVGNIEENDIEIAKKIEAMKIPFCFVRSKMDVDIQNSDKDGESEKGAVEKIKSKLSGNLKDAGLNKVKYFIISNNNRSFWQFNELVSYIERNLPRLKCDAVMLSILAELSVDDIDRRYDMLKDRIWKISVASFALVTGSVSCTDIVINMSLICNEFLLYYKAFGFEQQIVKDILKDDIRQKLNASSIIEIKTNEAMHAFAKFELDKLRTSKARESPNHSNLPLIETVVSKWPSGVDTFRLLTQVLDGCRDDAKLVYSHLTSAVDYSYRSTEASTTDDDMTL